MKLVERNLLAAMIGTLFLGALGDCTASADTATQPATATRPQVAATDVYKMTIPELMKTAENGNPFAQFWLGQKYHDGNGVPHDEQLALSWLRKSAEGGFTMAHLLIAGMYEEGRGVEKNPVEAARACYALCP